MSLCYQEMRGGVCQLDTDHRGRHTTVAFECDFCGVMRRGRPTIISDRMPDGYLEPVAGICFPCERGFSKQAIELQKRAERAELEAYA